MSHKFSTKNGLATVLSGARYKGEFVLNNETEYNNIDWHDIRDKPTWVDVELAGIARLRYDIKEDINERTKEMIEHDFMFSLDPVTTVEMSDEWQRNVLGLYTGEAMFIAGILPMQLLTYPYELHVGSGNEVVPRYITIADFAELTQLYLEIFNHINTMLLSGRTLKNDLGAMGRNELEEFRDTR